MARTYWLETLGCPKNEVDSEKLAAHMAADGLVAVEDPADADLVVVNTCAFIEEAREESVATILELHDQRREGSELVVTGCMAQRYGDELAGALPEADRISGFGVPLYPEAVPVTLGLRASGHQEAQKVPELDLLNLPRPASTRPWAYVKVAEGCDKRCGFCAIPSFRGPQQSRSIGSITDEVEALGVREVVLVAQDLGAYGRDGSHGQRRITDLFTAVSEHVEWVRLLYLFPSELRDPLLEAIASSPVPYFDLSLQHVSAPLVRAMRRPGSSHDYLERIETIRSLNPAAALRSNFIVGYPGETEEDHDRLLEFVAAARLDWCGFFAYSREDGTYAAGLDGAVQRELVTERLAELREAQDRITAERRDELIGDRLTVLVDEPGIARSHREAPEIDGIIEVPEDLTVGEFHEVRVTGARGPDLVGERPLHEAPAGVSEVPVGTQTPGMASESR
ncbi:MAG: 30S ribosomal protein S12 methylthiotransferase RimO [Microthrixaceae bacterium]